MLSAAAAGSLRNRRFSTNTPITRADGGLERTPFPRRGFAKFGVEGEFPIEHSEQGLLWNWNLCPTRHSAPMNRPSRLRDPCPKANGPPQTQPRATPWETPPQNPIPP